MLDIRVLATADENSGLPADEQTVVVIDVLRATSVITTALANGAKRIYPVADIGAALNFGRREEIKPSLIAGERGGIRVQGFDLGNSPHDFTPELIHNKNIVLCTSNGTKALHKNRHAFRLLTASFLNISAVAEALLQFNNPLVLQCSGTNGKFSQDDALCAGMLINRIRALRPVRTDDLGGLLSHWAAETGSIRQKLQHCTHLNYLISIGCENDIDYCLQTDLLSVVPMYQQQDGYLSL